MRNRWISGLSHIKKRTSRFYNCWAHARRRLNEAVKTFPTNNRNKIAYQALKQIYTMYRIENIY